VGAQEKGPANWNRPSPTKKSVLEFYPRTSRKNRLVDRYTAFSELAIKHTWLAGIESRVRVAKPKNRQHLHRGVER
jgi:hypothetical protein